MLCVSLLFFLRVCAVSSLDLSIRAAIWLGSKSSFFSNSEVCLICSFIHPSNCSIGFNNILVYCINGLTISPLICSLYLLKYGKLNKYDIPAIFKSKNDQVLLNIDELNL